MKYFVEATIVDKTSDHSMQSINYEVNIAEASITLETIKAALIPKIKVPKDYVLLDGKFWVRGINRDLSFPITEGVKVFYDADIEKLPKVEKSK